MRDNSNRVVVGQLVGVRDQRLKVTHSAAGQCRRCQRWRRCEAVCLHDASLYRPLPPQQSKPAAICTG